MKKFLYLTIVLLYFSLTLSAQKNNRKFTFDNPDAPIEARIKDALLHMTLHEKIKILHAQSKFTSAGVPRLGIHQLNYRWTSWRSC